MMRLSLKLALILANNADPDKMQYYAAFYLGLNCLPIYPFRGFQYIEAWADPDGGGGGGGGGGGQGVPIPPPP